MSIRKRMYKVKTLGLFVLVIAVMSCSKDPNSPGYEYMPDMYRSQAIEAYVDYGLVADDEYSDDAKKRRRTMSAKTPPIGTISFKTKHAELYMPYTYPDTEEGYKMASENKIPALFLEDVEGNVKEGKRLYNLMCQHCHGRKGKGDGGVVEVGGFNPPSAYNGPYKDRTLGTIYHVITYGKGAMGPHKSQLNREDRWKVAMYVRTLQHDGDFKLEDLLKSEEKTKEEQ